MYDDTRPLDVRPLDVKPLDVRPLDLRYEFKTPGFNAKTPGCKTWMYGMNLTPLDVRHGFKAPGCKVNVSYEFKTTKPDMKF